MADTQPIVMVIDDHPDFVQSVKLILESEGYQVWTAANGQEALNRLENDIEVSVPDLILADIMMPIMDGYKLYERVQARSKLRGVPFIFLTAKTAASDLLYGKELGIEDYLTKPCAPEVLLASVGEQIKKSEHIGADKHEMITEPYRATKGVKKVFATNTAVFLSGTIIIIIIVIILNLVGIPWG